MLSIGWPALSVALRAMGAVALGHVASMVLVAGAALLGASIGPGTWAAMGAVPLCTLLGWRCIRRHRVGRTSFALGSFVLTSLHGAGHALVPALLPLCAGY